MTRGLWLLPFAALVCMPALAQAPPPAAPAESKPAAEPPNAQAPATPPTASASQEETPPPLLIAPPLFSQWVVKGRYDDAAQLAGAAGYDPAHVEDAIRAYRTVLELYPGNCYQDTVAWQICSLTERLRDPPKAMAAYASYLDQCPDGDNAVDALWSLISHLNRARDYPGALARYDQLVKTYPTSYYLDDALYGIASRLQAEDDHSAAADAYLGLAKRCPDSDYADDALNQVASLYRTYPKDYKAAVDVYRELLTKYPYSDLVDDALYGILGCYVSMREIGRAVDLYNSFVKMFPSSSYVKYMQSQLSSYTARYSGALAPNPDEGPSEPLYQQVTDLYNQAYALTYVKRYGDAVAAYRALLAQFPDSDYTDDAVLALGDCYQQLHEYYVQAEKASTPEEIAQVEQDWDYVVGAHKGIDGASQLDDAISAYVWLANSLPGSDLRDDALYQAAQCYGAMHDQIGQLVAYLELIERFPRSAYAPTALDCIDSLKSALKTDADKLKVYNTVISLYPECAASDDYLYEIGQMELAAGDLRSATTTFGKYVTMYPHRAHAGESEFLLGRCRELLHEPQFAVQAYAQVLSGYPSSGLADDAYIEAVRAQSIETLDADMAQSKAIGAAVEKALGRSITGYDVILRPHVAVLVPFRDSTRIRAYNLPDRFEDAYGLLQHWTGVEPTPGKRLDIVLDPDFNGLKAGDPVQIGMNYCGDPPMWVYCFQPIAERFTAAQPLAAVTDAVPGFANGLARLAALQLDHGLFESIGPTELGPQTVTQHLSQVVALKQGARDALVQHIKAKEPVEKANGMMALGMLLNVVEARKPADEVIDWTPLHPFFAQAASLPPEAKKLEKPEERAALVVVCMARSLGVQSTKALETLGVDVPQDVLEKVEAIVDGKEPPAKEEPPAAPQPQPPAAPATAPKPQ